MVAWRSTLKLFARIVIVSTPLVTPFSGSWVTELKRLYISGESYFVLVELINCGALRVYKTI